MMKRNKLFFLVVLFFVLTSCNIFAKNNKTIENNTTSIDNVSTGEASDIDIEEAAGYEYWLLPEYDYVSDFSSDYGLLCKDDLNILVDNEYNLITSTSEYEVVYLSEDKICFKSYENLKYGLMDRNGVVIVEPEYDSPLMFYDGMAYARKGERFGYLNTRGELIIDYDYSWVTPFKEGIAAVGISEDEFWFINKRGEVMSGPYELLNPDATVQTMAYLEYSEGYTAFFERSDGALTQTYGGQGYWGYLDKKGNIAIPAQYSFVRPFSEGLAAVVTKDGRCIYIDKNGEEVMEAFLADFYNGLAFREDGFIDKSGNMVFKIPEGYTTGSSYQKGCGNFYLGDLMVVYKERDESKAAVMDKQGNILLESDEFEEIKIFRDNYVAVKIDGKWGIIKVNQ